MQAYPPQRPQQQQQQQQMTTVMNAANQPYFPPVGYQVVYQPIIIERYNKRLSIGFGTTLVVAGTLAVIFNIVSLLIGLYGFIGHGFWGGGLCIITGGIGIGAGTKKTRNLENAAVAMESLLAILALLEAIISIWGSVICCKAYCCCECDCCCCQTASANTQMQPGMNGAMQMVIINTNQQSAPVMYPAQGYPQGVPMQPGFGYNNQAFLVAQPMNIQDQGYPQGISVQHPPGYHHNNQNFGGAQPPYILPQGYSQGAPAQPGFGYNNQPIGGLQPPYIHAPQGTLAQPGFNYNNQAVGGSQPPHIQDPSSQQPPSYNAEVKPGGTYERLHATNEYEALRNNTSAPIPRSADNSAVYDNEYLDVRVRNT